MENKFEKLIDLIINENEEQARELFHDIVVEKSREIYESLMDEEMMEQGEEDEMDEGMGGQVGDLLDEINSEESGGMTEDESDDEMLDLDVEAETDDDFGGDEGDSEDLEDRVVKVEDKLDELMAEFEAIMGGEEAGEEDELAGAEEEEAGEEEEEAGEEEEALAEAVQLQKVSVTHGDDGAQKKSPVAANSGKAGMDSKPVKFSGDNEAVPTGPKGPSNYGSKGETQVKGAGSFKNAPGQKGQDLSKAPAPVKSQASGVNTKSPVAK